MPDKALRVDLAEHGRRLPYGNGTGTEAFDGKPKLAEFLGKHHQPVAILFRQIDDLGNEQDL